MHPVLADVLNAASEELEQEAPVCGSATCHVIDVSPPSAVLPSAVVRTSRRDLTLMTARIPKQKAKTPSSQPQGPGSRIV